MFHAKNQFASNIQILHTNNGKSMIIKSYINTSRHNLLHETSYVQTP